jgi:hypothetical protein
MGVAQGSAVCPDMPREKIKRRIRQESRYVNPGIWRSQVAPMARHIIYDIVTA